MLPHQYDTIMIISFTLYSTDLSSFAQLFHALYYGEPLHFALPANLSNAVFLDRVSLNTPKLFA